MAKRRFLNMPVHIVCHARTLQTAPGTVYRAVLAIAVAYWHAGCQFIDTDDMTLAPLARLPQQHIGPIKTHVIAALNEICPDLDEAYQRAGHILASKQQSAQRATESRSAHVARRKATSVTQSIIDTPATQTGIATRLATIPIPNISELPRPDTITQTSTRKVQAAPNSTGKGSFSD